MRSFSRSDTNQLPAPSNATPQGRKMKASTAAAPSGAGPGVRRRAAAVAHHVVEPAVDADALDAVRVELGDVDVLERVDGDGDRVLDGHVDGEASVVDRARARAVADQQRGHAAGADL